jgi:hypothetical protein
MRRAVAADGIFTASAVPMAGAQHTQFETSAAIFGRKPLPMNPILTVTGLTHTLHPASAPAASSWAQRSDRRASAHPRFPFSSARRCRRSAFSPTMTVSIKCRKRPAAAGQPVEYQISTVSDTRMAAKPSCSWGGEGRQHRSVRSSGFSVRGSIGRAGNARRVLSGLGQYLQNTVDRCQRRTFLSNFQDITA